jgi:hypothetical protein
MVGIWSVRPICLDSMPHCSQTSLEFDRECLSYLHAVAVAQRLLVLGSLCCNIESVQTHLIKADTLILHHIIHVLHVVGESIILACLFSILACLFQ